ncbi:MAG TPA: hypothetical protein VH877_09235, partial [Polyangia bacterium]|nr:hypothetical protein [Polyangia bacterium]
MRLSNRRELPARTDDERRERLARSYRGDFGEFFRDLRSQDLFELLRNALVDGNRRYRLKYVSTYSKKQLIRFLVEFFVHGCVPRAFEEEVLEEEEEDEEDDLEDEDEDENEDEGEDDEDDEGEDEGEDEDEGDDEGDEDEDDEDEDDDDKDEDEEPEAPAFAPGEQHRLLPYFSDVTEEWSRPRLIRRVL